MPTKIGAGVPEHRDLVNLPVLNAVIQETMRKHPPVPMGLLRETPREGKTIEGYFIPQKVSLFQPFKYDSLNIHLRPSSLSLLGKPIEILDIFLIPKPSCLNAG